MQLEHDFKVICGTTLTECDVENTQAQRWRVKLLGYISCITPLKPCLPSISGQLIL